MKDTMYSVIQVMLGKKAAAERLRAQKARRQSIAWELAAKVSLRRKAPLFVDGNKNV